MLGERGALNCHQILFQSDGTQGSLPGMEPPENIGENGKGKGWKKTTNTGKREKNNGVRTIVRPPQSLLEKEPAPRKDIDD